MQVEFDYLIDHPEAVPQVIRWWHSVWADRMGSDLEDLAQQLRCSLSRDQLPIHIVACVRGQVVGTAALKRQELADRYPDCQYWLGSVFVDAGFRGQGIAGQLSRRVIELARDRHLPHLYLQTVAPDGGLYASLGWQALERFTYRGEPTLLMINRFNEG